MTKTRKGDPPDANADEGTVAKQLASGGNASDADQESILKELREQRRGIRALPHPWGTIAEMVGTYGLAVALVLMYVIKLGPQFTQLQQSVNRNTEVIDRNTDVIKDRYVVVFEDRQRAFETMFITGFPVPFAQCARQRMIGIAATSDWADVSTRDDAETEELTADIIKDLNSCLESEVGQVEGLIKTTAGEDFADVIRRKLKEKEVAGSLVAFFLGGFDDPTLGYSQSRDKVTTRCVLQFYRVFSLDD